MDETQRMQALAQPLPVAEPEDKITPDKKRRARESPAKEAFADPAAGGLPNTEAVSQIRESVAALDTAVVATLLAHPDTLRSALLAVAHGHQTEALAEEAETITGPPARLLGHEEAERRLSQRTRVGEKEGDELLTSDEFAQRVGAKSRQSVHNWLKKGRVVGWEGAKRGLVFPAEQLDERGKPLDGLGVILSSFDGHYSAWRWLTSRDDALDGSRPIDLLRRNDIARVESAAKGYAQGDFG